MRRQLMTLNYFLFGNANDLSTYNHLAVTVKAEKEVKYIKYTKEGVLACIIVPVTKRQEALKEAQKMILRKRYSSDKLFNI